MAIYRLLTSYLKHKYSTVLFKTCNVPQLLSKDVILLSASVEANVYLKIGNLTRK
jgi:hypothetical protein